VLFASNPIERWGLVFTYCMRTYWQQQSRNTSTLPVSLTDLKAHLSISGTNDDSRLTMLEWAAVDYIERQTARCLVPTTGTEISDHFPTWYKRSYSAGFEFPYLVYPFLMETPTGMPWNWGRIMRIELLKSPVTSINSVTYYDINNNLQTLVEGTDYYVVMPTDRPAFLQPVQVWPIPYFRPDAVQISYSCGYTVPADGSGNLPYVIDAAIKLLVGAWNENREDFNVNVYDKIPIGVEALLESISTGGYF
jgi:hypothetical protein